MNKASRRIKVFVLSLLAVLGLMTAIATAAQAGEFKVAGSTFAAAGIVEKEVTGTIAAGKYVVPNLGLEYACTGGVITTGTLLRGGTVHGTVLFSGCSIVGNANCSVYETQAQSLNNENPGNIRISGLGHLVLHEGGHYLLVTSTTGKIWTNSPKKLCTLPKEESVEVEGKGEEEAPFGEAFFILEALNEQLTHVFDVLTVEKREKLVTELGYNLGIRCNGQPASLVGGSTTVKLTSNQNWSAE